jgi:hypothetical protein
MGDLLHAIYRTGTFVKGFCLENPVHANRRPTSMSSGQDPCLQLWSLGSVSVGLGTPLAVTSCPGIRVIRVAAPPGQLSTFEEALSGFTSKCHLEEHALNW